MDVIIYLGAENDAEGVLSETARVRAQGALDVYRSRPGAKLLVTGGYGGHFNTAPLPHAHYVVQHLLDQGVPADDLLPIVESRHTVEDAVLSRETLAPLNVRSICVVTSEYHVQRAQLIFSCFFDPALLSFVSTPSCLTPERLLRREAHEQQSIALIHRQGGILYGGKLWPLPAPFP
jgi:uncharacterized SAM-binding protein YcdF (DUF218 family)